METGCLDDYRRQLFIDSNDPISIKKSTLTRERTPGDYHRQFYHSKV
jgi:hypothetical protein